MKDKAIVSSATLNEIGEAIIEKGGANGPIKPRDMPAAIRDIHGDVLTVNDIQPDDSGNVSLDATDIPFSDATMSSSTVGDAIGEVHSAQASQYGEFSSEIADLYTNKADFSALDSYLSKSGGVMDSGSTIQGLAGINGADGEDMRILLDSHSTLQIVNDIKWYYGGDQESNEIATIGDIDTVQGNVDTVQSGLDEVFDKGLFNDAYNYITDSFQLYSESTGDVLYMSNDGWSNRWEFMGRAYESYYSENSGYAYSLEPAGLASTLQDSQVTHFVNEAKNDTDVRSVYPGAGGYQATALQKSSFQAFNLEHDTTNSENYFYVGGKGTGLTVCYVYNSSSNDYQCDFTTAYDSTNRRNLTTQRIGGFASNHEVDGATVICTVESDTSSYAVKPLAYYSTSSYYYGRRDVKPCTFPSNTVTTSATAAAFNAKSGIWCITTVGNVIDTSRYDAPQPICMLSKDGKTFQVGPSVSASCSAYAVVPYEDGFMFMRDASDEEGQMLKCTNVKQVNGVWTWDLTSMTLFTGRAAFEVTEGDMQIRGFAYGNGFFLAGTNIRNKLAKIEPNGRYSVIDLPNSDDTVKSIVFHKGTFYIAAGNYLYMTMTGESNDIRVFNSSYGTYSGKCYGVGASDKFILVAAEAYGAIMFERTIDTSLSKVSVIQSIAAMNYKNGEELTF